MLLTFKHNSGCSRPPLAFSMEKRDTKDIQVAILFEKLSLKQVLWPNSFVRFERWTILVVFSDLSLILKFWRRSKRIVNFHSFVHSFGHSIPEQKTEMSIYLSVQFHEKHSWMWGRIKEREREKPVQVGWFVMRLQWIISIVMTRKIQYIVSW